MGILIDLRGRTDQLASFELSWLVSGLLAAWSADRYCEVCIVAPRLICQQIRIFTRLSYQDIVSIKEDR
jgi:hypothetical protein